MGVNLLSLLKFQFGSTQDSSGDGPCGSDYGMPIRYRRDKSRRAVDHRMNSGPVVKEFMVYGDSCGINRYHSNQGHIRVGYIGNRTLDESDGAGCGNLDLGCLNLAGCYIEKADNLQVVSLFDLAQIQGRAFVAH